MKPLSTAQKKFIYGTLVYGRLRVLARPLYESVIVCELAAHRLFDAAAGRETYAGTDPVDRLTMVVKTFERPHLAARLIRSIRRHYPDAAVIVVDDSREPTRFPGVQNLHLPYNSGISAGRNEALQRVETPFVLILDDDFVFTRRTRLRGAMRTMIVNPDIDIMGGQVVDLPLYITHDYRRAAIFPTEAEPVRLPGSLVAGLPVTEKVPNFFIGRSDGIRRVGWNPKLKLLEHADFFSRARGVLTTVMNERLQVLHARTPFDLGYMRIRQDLRRYQVILHSIHQRDRRGRSGQH